MRPIVAAINVTAITLACLLSPHAAVADTVPTATSEATAKSTPESTAVPKATAAPAGGVSILSPDAITDLLTRQSKAAEFGRATRSDAGILLTTVKLPKAEYNLEMQAPIATAVEPGQVLLLRFAARSVKAATMTGQTQLAIYFQKTSPDWKKNFYSYVDLSDGWRRYDFPIRVRDRFGPGEAAAYFAFGFQPQVAEIADVQLIAYPVGTDINTIPRTERPVGVVTDEAYNRAIARIGEYRALLNQKPPITPPPGARELHVAVDAAPGGDGSTARPFRTVQAAINIAEPGDTILVGPGTYDAPDQQSTLITRSGRPDAWITIRPAPNAGRPKFVSGKWQVFEVSGAKYIQIQGFELVGVPSAENKNSGNGIGAIKRASHVRILDNIIHGFGGGGIYGYSADYLHIEGNVVYSTSHGSDWGNSAISLYQCINSDDLPGYHNVIRRNICYLNENKIPFRFGGGGITDGNGIIIDDNRHTQHESKEGVYRHWTLIENNLVYNNGGRGIHCFLADRVDVINNTLYLNQFTREIRGGEVTASQSSEINFFNNIIFARPDKRANSTDGSRGDNIISNNLFFNSDDIIPGRDALLGKDPLLSQPNVAATDPEAFRPLPGSPAVDAGLPAVAPADDLFGRPRTGRPDLGAIETR